MAAVQHLDLERALTHLRRVDTKLSALIRLHGRPEFSRTRNAFKSLAQAIVYQQLSGQAAATIYGRFLNLFAGRRFPKPADLLAVPISQLRSAGLSNQKATYLHDLAHKFADGSIQPRRFSRMSDEEIGRALIQVKGIGQWSIDMFLMFALNRPDILPVGDLGIRKGFQQFFGLKELPDAEVMVPLAEPWRPYRTVASWYMWRVVDAAVPL